MHLKNYYWKSFYLVYLLYTNYIYFVIKQMCDAVKSRAEMRKVCVLTLGSVIGNMFDPYKNSTSLEAISNSTGYHMREFEVRVEVISKK